MSTILDEHTIKQVALKYLRKYYRDKPTEGQTLLAFDLRGEGGIKADGYLKFTVGEGQEHEVVLEATSRNTRDEVKFRPLPIRLNLDSIAVGTWMAAAGLGVAVQQFWISWEKGGFPLFSLVFGLLFVSFFLAYRVLFRNQRRYRYIYAIEQFKAFHSDDQWIAIGADVFEDKTGGFFRELRNQCIYHGVGLLEVGFDSKPRLILSASMGTLEMGKRKRVRLSRFQGWTTPLYKPLEEGSRKLTNRLLKAKRYRNTRDLMRFQRGYWKQMAAILSGLVVVGALAERVWAERPVRTLSKAEQQELIEKKTVAHFQEPSYYIVDTVDFKPFEKGNTPFFQMDVDPEAPEEEPRVDYVTETPGISRDQPGLLVALQPDSVFTYPCRRLSLVPDTYVLADRVLANREDAIQRVLALQEISLDCQALNLACFQGGSTGYLVYWQAGFITGLEARVALGQYRRLRDADPGLPELTLRRIREFLE